MKTALTKELEDIRQEICRIVDELEGPLRICTLVHTIDRLRMLERKLSTLQTVSHDDHV